MYIEHVFLGENNSMYIGLEYDSAITLASDTALTSIPLSSFDKRHAIYNELNGL